MLAFTCTFFKGCPFNKMDQVIAYDLIVLMTSYKRKAASVKKS